MPRQRSNPDLLVKQGGKKELVLEAAKRREGLSERSGYPVKEIDSFIFEFNGMRRMMVQQLKVHHSTIQTV